LATRARALSIFATDRIHGFFQDLIFHRLLAQKALKFRTASERSKLQKRNHFSGRNGGEAAFLILLLPL
jgi:hypothetical protein